MERITFDQLPEIVGQILKKLERIEAILENSEIGIAQTKPMLTAIEAAKFMGISMSLLYKLTSAKQIATYKPNGKKLYFQKSDLVTWISKNRQATNDEMEQLAIEYVTKKRMRK